MREPVRPGRNGIVAALAANTPQAQAGNARETGASAGWLVGSSDFVTPDAPLVLSGGLRPPEPPYWLARGGPAPRSALQAHSLPLVSYPGGFAPRSPPTGSLAGAPAPRSAPQAHSLPLVSYPGGFAPRSPPTGSLAGAPRPAPLSRLTHYRSFLIRGASPPEPPYWLARGGPRAPLRSPGSLTTARSRSL